ncbi:MAG: peptidylprolyl isomerase [Synechococcaceae cyanobacterium]
MDRPACLDDAPVEPSGIASGECLIEMPPGRPWLAPAELNRLMRQQGLALAIAQAWVLDEVVCAVELPPEEEEQLVAAYLQAEGASDPQARAALLTSMGFGEDDLRYFATKGRRLQLYRQRCHADEVELRFLERKLDLDLVTYSLIRVEEQELAEELYQQLREGEADFPELARQHSRGQERFTRGLVGPVPISRAHPEVVNRLRSGEPGQLWEPFELPDVWLVMRLEQVFPAELDEAMAERMMAESFDRWFNERVRMLMAGETLPSLPRQRLEVA